MEKKQILTNTEIEKDIITALKNPPKESKASDKRSTLVAVILVILLVAIEVIYPVFILWLLLAVAAFITVYSIFERVRLKKRIENVTIDRYDITTETVHSTAEEHYRAEAGGSISHRRTERVDNFIIRFENGKSWRVPKELYHWNERLRQCAGGIYNTTHRGDILIAVTEKSTGKIVVAYHTEIFEYKN